MPLRGGYEKRLKKDTGSKKLKGNGKDAWESHPEWLCEETWPSIVAELAGMILQFVWGLGQTGI